jgi:hypothetical protein
MIVEVINREQVYFVLASAGAAVVYAVLDAIIHTGLGSPVHF